jgi:hypothetical protein
MRRFVTGLSALALSMCVVLVPRAFAQAKPSLVVLSPKAGDTVISTDIPVLVQVSNFSHGYSARRAGHESAGESPEWAQPETRAS